MQTTGERLKAVRTTLELTQEQFGARIGLSAAKIDALEKDNIVFDSDFLVRFKYRYPEVDLTWLQRGGPLFLPRR